MKVDFYIAGIQKSGTTNLAYLLSQSSNIITHPQMECTYYWDSSEYNQGKSFLRRNYFFNVNDSLLDNHRILLKHSNSFTQPDTLKKAYDDNKDILFLLIFRNPVQRFVSSYLMEKTRSLYAYDLQTCIERALKDKNSFEHKCFLSFGKYDVWLKNILKIIPEKISSYFCLKNYMMIKNII